MFYGIELAMLGSPLGSKLKSEAQRENSITFAELFNRFANIATTRLVWHGLPDSVSERFLNQSLFYYGQAAFFEDPNLGFMALPCNVAGEYNVYYDPVRVNAFSFNYNRLLNFNDFVYIRNNPTCTPTAFTVWTYTKRMADILRTVDITLHHIKRPYIILCDEKKRLTYENILKKIDDNEWFILGSKEFGLKNTDLDKLDLRVETDLEELWGSYQNMERILFTSLGIYSAANEKKERLLVDEVNADVMVTDMSLESTIKELEHACDQINDKWGLDVSVELKKIADYQLGGEQYGQVYDRTE